MFEKLGKKTIVFLFIILVQALSIGMYSLTSTASKTLTQDPRRALSYEESKKTRRAEVADQKQFTKNSINEDMKSALRNYNGLPENIVFNFDKDTHLNVNLRIGNRSISHLLDKIIKTTENISHLKTLKSLQVNPSLGRNDFFKSQKVMDGTKPSIVGRRKKSFLTLFTSWAFNPKLFSITNNTMFNWKSFFPTVSCIVFTNDSRIERTVMPKYCDIRKIYRYAKNGLPVLKHMYQYAMDIFDSEFYAYANSDILFTDNLIKSLLVVKYSNSNNEPVLITGQRWNVIGAKKNEVTPKEKLTDFTSKNGSLFHVWAADYFVTSRNVPWGNFDEVVIGSLGLDNWVIIQSRKLGVRVIDATKTILAVHQSLDRDLYQSHKREFSNYNKDLLQSKYGPLSFIQGQINCIQNYTDVEIDRIFIKTRLLADPCKL